MKKLLLTISLFVSIGALAQTEKGTWLISGSTDLSYTSTSFDGFSDNVNSFDLTTRAGSFVADNLVLGLDLSISTAKQGDNKSTLTSIGPFFRYYVEGGFFVGAAYSAATSKFKSGTFDDSESGGLLAFEAGYPIWLLDNIALEPSLNYGVGSGDLFDGTSAFGLNIGFGLYF